MRRFPPRKINPGNIRFAPGYDKKKFQTPMLSTEPAPVVNALTGTECTAPGGECAQGVWKHLY